MPLHDLIKKPDNSIAPDRALYGDQYDIKIDALYADLLTLALALDSGTGSGVGIGGFPLPTGAPSAGDYIVFDGTNWVYSMGTSGPPTGSAGGDLALSYPNPKVVKVQSEAVSSTPPTDGQIWVYDGVTTHSWVPTSPATITSNAGSIQTSPVSSTPPTTNQTFIYTGGAWTPVTLPLTTQNILPIPPSPIAYLSGSGGTAAFITAAKTDQLGFMTLHQDDGSIHRGILRSSGTTDLYLDSTKRPGWVLIQPQSNNSTYTRFFDYALPSTYTNVAVWLSLSMDSLGFTPVSDIPSYLQVQFLADDGSGHADNLNGFGLKIAGSGPSSWTIESYYLVTGAKTTTGTITVTDSDFPSPVICMQILSSSVSTWFGLDKNSMTLAGSSFALPSAPKYVTMDIFSNNSAATTIFGFNQLLVTNEALL